MDDGTARTGVAPRAERAVEALYERIDHLQAQIAQLQDALSHRLVVEQAKGMLMHRYTMDAETAYRLLERWSSLSDLDVQLVAQALVAVGERAGMSSPASSAGDILSEVDHPVLQERLHHFASWQQIEW